MGATGEVGGDARVGDVGGDAWRTGEVGGDRREAASWDEEDDEADEDDISEESV